MSVAPRFFLPAFCFTLLVLCPSLRAGEEEDFVAEGQQIVDVQIEGKARISFDRILNNLKTKKGGVYSKAVISQDIKSLYENKKFRIWAVPWVEEVPGGVKVTFKIEQEILRSVRFLGVVNEDEEDLRDLLGLRKEMIISRHVISSYAHKLTEYYRGKGYYFAEVRHWAEATEGGMGLVFDIFEGEKVTVEEIRFVGNVELDTDDLTGLMDLSEPTLWIFTTQLKESVLQGDIAKLNDFARREGFLDAKISLDEIRFNDNRDGAEIVIRVQEYRRYRVGKITIDFIGMCEAFTREEIFALVEFEEGDFYKQARIDRARRRIEQLYGNAGYLRAYVPPPSEIPHEVDPAVDLIFQIDEGTQKKVRDVIIEGNTHTKDKVIRRELWLYPGDIFSREEMLRSKGDLNALRYFTDARGMPRVLMQNRKTEDEDLEDLYVKVDGAGKTSAFIFTMGLSTDGGVFGGGSVVKENFDLTDMPSSALSAPIEFFSRDAFYGGGQTLRLSAFPGTVESSYNISFYEPYLFDTQPHPVSFKVTGYRSLLSLSDYDESRTGMATTFGKRLTREVTVSLGFRNEQIKLRNVVDDAPLEVQQLEGTTGSRSLETAIRYHNVDNNFNPSKGFTARLGYEYFGGVLGDDLDLHKTVLDTKAYIPLYRPATGPAHVLILKGAVGMEKEFHDLGRIPIFERFHMGGSTGSFALRGFDWRGVGPQVGGESLGGEFAYALSAEYLIPIYSYYDRYYDVETPIVRGVVFVDAGSLGDDIRSTKQLRDIRLGTGVGLRITLPVFQGLPIALDYGIPVRKYGNDDRRSFSFSIKTSF